MGKNNTVTIFQNWIKCWLYIIFFVILYTQYLGFIASHNKKKNHDFLNCFSLRLYDI